MWQGVDSNGSVVIKGEFDSCSPFYDGRAAVQIGEKRGFIDYAGKLVIPAIYESTGRFSEGLTAVKQGGKWGYIDLNGKMAIAPRFEWEIKSGGLAAPWFK